MAIGSTGLRIAHWIFASQAKETCSNADFLRILLLVKQIPRPRFQSAKRI